MNTISSPTASRPWDNLPAQGPLLRPIKAAKYLGISKSLYYDLVAKGKLPRPIPFAAQVTVVPRAWLDAVIANLLAEAAR